VDRKAPADVIGESLLAGRQAATPINKKADVGKSFLGLT